MRQLQTFLLTMKKLILLFITFANVSLAQNIKLEEHAFVPIEHKVTLQPCLKPFYHGVASGDPLTDRVIIWTRVTPDSAQITQTLTVNWQIATDTAMFNVVNSGVALTDSSKDFTIKVDANGLNAGTFYYYEFKIGNYYSPRGRTRTAPSGNIDSLRFALVSCANFEAGWFNVYNSLLQRSDFDAVLSLGDYIYEYETGGYSPNTVVNRQWSPATEILSIADYRMRYSSYRLDDDLQRLHQQFPFIIVYDDHELANDAWKNGAGNHTTATEGLWSDRKLCAQKAFFEWLPIRKTGTTDPYQIYRNIKYGNLVELMMLDTRVTGRDLQAGTTGTVVADTNRRLIGEPQMTWLKNKLDSTNCQWKVLGQQVMIAPVKLFGVAINGDQWDGYPAERDRIYNHVLGKGIQNMVVVTGDIHSSWACDLPTSTYNSLTGAGSAGVEFVTPSVTSPGSSIPGGATALQISNSHIKWVELSQHGYIIMDVNKTKTQSDWFHIPTLDTKTSSYVHVKSYYVSTGQRFLKTTSTATIPRNSIYGIKAPLCPRTATSTDIKPFSFKPGILSVFPNPSNALLTIQLFNITKGDVTFKVINAEGKEVESTTLQNTSDGINNYSLKTSGLAAGVYFVRIETTSGSTTVKFVKQ